ncbi:hypothetical protein, partial [Cereibacter sphaeroides]|uniref:hypothetical protein n=1 Tax=Cereibacter sphaeroides TaxID=1063 RepID=UPI001F327486
MKIVTEFRPREGGADIWMRTDTSDPPWMMLRWEEARNKVSGFAGSPSAGSIAKVRPVTFTAREIELNTVGTCAAWCFVQAHGLSIHSPEAPAGRSLNQQVQTWEAFLGATTPRSAGKAQAKAGPAVQDDTIVLEAAALDWLQRQGRIRKRQAEFLPVRTPLLKVGLPVSGFEAMKIQAAAAKIFPVLAPPAGLDIEAARAALAAVARPSSHAVVWYASATGETARDRRQAAAIAPVLAEMIAENPTIARTVDERLELQPLLLERSGLTKAGLKRLGKVTESLPAARLFEEGAAVRGEDALGVNRQRRFTVSGTVSLDVALRHLAALPPDRVPQENADWLIFHDVLAACAIPIENAFEIPVARTLGAAKGDWKSLHATLARAADFPVDRFDRRAMALTTIDAIEAVEDFARSVILPQCLASIVETGEPVPEVSGEHVHAAFVAATKIMTGDAKNVAATALEAARRYASRIPALMAATGFEGGEEIAAAHLADRWARYGTEAFPLLTGEFTAANGLVVRPLPDFDAMRLESERLGHCVGRMYLGKARQGNCHIYSVQSGDGSISHSTS